MKILVAPDKFKDALTAAEAAAAIAAGIAEARPDATIVQCPMADGGDGTGRVLAGALGAEQHRENVVGPRGAVRRAIWWLTRDASTAIVEMAEASGLALLPPEQRNPLATTSFGTGQLLAAALAAGAARVLLCVGGSATVDGGAGCLQALGWELLDEHGATLTRPATGVDLPKITTARLPNAPNRRRIPEIRVLCDVDNPLLGPDGAAAGFGPQKGASAEAVAQLERGLQCWAAILEKLSGGTVGFAGAGAAGGLPAALVAATGAIACPGFDEVARVVGLIEKLTGCAICVTGEGRLDEQTLRGKVVHGVARAARVAGVETIALVGTIQPPAGSARTALVRALGLRDAFEISRGGESLPEALRQTGQNLQRSAREWFRSPAGRHPATRRPP